jgi:RNA recognition motif-containing protein
VFVGSIPFESTETEISQFFQQCGSIQNCKLLHDPQTRRFKGSCFIRFESVDAAQQACTLNGSMFMGRKLYISMSASRPAPQTTPHVFIGNLDSSSDHETLMQFFSPCGTVKNIKLITDRLTGRNRGYAFVEFADEQSAKNSLALNGKMLGSRPIRVDFQRPKSARPRTPRGTMSGRGNRNHSHHGFPPMSPHMAAAHPSTQLPWAPSGTPTQYAPPFPPNYHLPNPNQPQGLMPAHPATYFPHRGPLPYAYYTSTMPYSAAPPSGYPYFIPEPQAGGEGLAPQSPGDAPRTSPSPSGLPSHPVSIMKSPAVGPTSLPPPPGSAPMAPASPGSRQKIPAAAYPQPYPLPDPHAGFPYPSEYLHQVYAPPSSAQPLPHSHVSHDKFGE